MKENIKIGEFIRKRRKLKGFSQSDLADLTGFQQDYISLVENGKKNITLSTLAKIVRPLGMTITFTDNEE